MSEININPNRRFLRAEKLPHFFCSGCGCGQVLNYYTQALDALGLNSEEMMCIAGVGCTARIPVYLKCDMFHGVHGRTLAWATGVKLMHPELPVVVFAGDGDMTSIGGNHLIHAARRNLDVTVIMVNNLNFAMTGGQVAPTTVENVRTMTTPYGNEEANFDVCALAQGAGASHVERWTTNYAPQCVEAIKRALAHKGFSLIEIISQCPTHYGRYALKTGDPIAVMEWIKQYTYTEADEKAGKPTEGKLKCGQFVCMDKPIYQGTSILPEGGQEA